MTDKKIKRNSEKEAQNFVKSIFSHQKFRMYHIEVARELGGAEYAVVLNDMMDQYEYLQSKDALVEHKDHGVDLMYYTESQAWERCAVKRKSFMSAIREFEDLGFIESFKFGIPYKKHYRFNFSKLAEWFSNISSRSSQRNLQEFPKELLGVPKGTSYDPNNDPEEEHHKAEQRAREEKDVIKKRPTR